MLIKFSKNVSIKNLKIKSKNKIQMQKNRKWFYDVFLTFYIVNWLLYTSMKISKKTLEFVKTIDIKYKDFRFNKKKKRFQRKFLHLIDLLKLIIKKWRKIQYDNTI